MNLIMPAKHTYCTTLEDFEQAVMEQLWFDPYSYREGAETLVLAMIDFDFTLGRAVEQSAERINNAIVVGRE